MIGYVAFACVMRRNFIFYFRFLWDKRKCLKSWCVTCGDRKRARPSGFRWKRHIWRPTMCRYSVHIVQCVDWSNVLSRIANNSALQCGYACPLGVVVGWLCYRLRRSLVDVTDSLPLSPLWTGNGFGLGTGFFGTYRGFTNGIEAERVWFISIDLPGVV